MSRSGNAAAGTAATAASPAAHASAAGSDDASRDSEVLSDLDSVFGDDVKDSVRAVDVTGDDVDRASIAELFTDIAGNQLPPVKNFVFELKRGTATKEWIEICRPVIETLAEAAESLNLTAEAVPMRDFAEALGIAADGDGKLIEGTTRDLLLDSYETMSRTLPHAFALGEDTKLREVIVIHALFKQVPDVGRVTFERLYGAGLTNLGILFQAQPEELASTTGIPEWLCERICTKLAEHRAELESSSVSQDGTAQRDRLREMLAELRDLNARYEHAAESEWKDESLAAEKRESRQERQMCALRIEVLLAEMGEMDLVEQFQKASFEQRINALESWLGLGGSRESAAPAMAGAGVHGSR